MTRKLTDPHTPVKRRKTSRAKKGFVKKWTSKTDAELMDFQNEMLDTSKILKRSNYYEKTQFNRSFRFII